MRLLEPRSSSLLRPCLRWNGSVLHLKVNEERGKSSTDFFSCYSSSTLEQRQMDHIDPAFQCSVGQRQCVEREPIWELCLQLHPSLYQHAASALWSWTQAGFWTPSPLTSFLDFTMLLPLQSLYVYIYMGPYRLSLYIYWSICLHTMSWCRNPRLQPQPVSPHSPIAMRSLSLPALSPSLLIYGFTKTISVEAKYLRCWLNTKVMGNLLKVGNLYKYSTIKIKCDF